MRKKLFAVIMSAMMMITFMPSMAFAVGEANVYAKNVVFDTTTYKTATADLYYADGANENTVAEKDVTLSTKRTFNASGLVEVKFAANSAGVGYALTSVKKATSGEFALTDVVASYYDLTNAKVVNNATVADIAKPSCNGDYYLSAIDQTNLVTGPVFNGSYQDSLLGAYVLLEEPADLVVAPATAAKKTVASSTFSSYLKATPAAYVAYEDNGDRICKVTFKNNIIAGNLGDSALTGGIINASAAVIDHPIYVYQNSVSKIVVDMAGLANTPASEVNLVTSLTAAKNGSATSLTPAYVAADQNFTVKTQGVSVEYSTDKGATWAAAAPAFKDVTTDAVEFLLKVTRGTNTVYGKVSVDVQKAPLTFAAKKAGTAPEFFFLPGQEVKASDLVKLTIPNVKDSANPINVDNADFINKFIKVSGIDSEVASYGQAVTLTFDSTAFSAEQLKDKALVDFLANFNTISSPVTVPTGIKVNFVKGENDITAPNQTKTYHVKKAAKLAKTKTFQLKDKAEYGKIKFTKLSGNSKIKVSSTGKVTVKKGLKKGTYTVKIKERVANTAAYYSATATKTLKVKIVK